MKAFLKNHRQSPRKVRLVANLIKGKKITDAETELKFLPKRAAFPMKKLLDSAVANAKQNGVEKENLIISNVTVNKGIVFKRFMPRARGSSSKINKRNSHVEITLKEKTDSKKVESKKEVKDTKTVKKEKVVKDKKVTKVKAKA